MPCIAEQLRCLHKEMQRGFFFCYTHCTSSTSSKHVKNHHNHFVFDWKDNCHIHPEYYTSTAAKVHLFLPICMLYKVTSNIHSQRSLANSHVSSEPCILHLLFPSFDFHLVDRLFFGCDLCLVYSSVSVFDSCPCFDTDFGFCLGFCKWILLSPVRRSSWLGYGNLGDLWRRGHLLPNFPVSHLCFMWPSPDHQDKVKRLIDLHLEPNLLYSVEDLCPDLQQTK